MSVFFELHLTGSLAEAAELLSGLLGVKFHEELTGRYEEYPAFVAQGMKASLSLLGHPLPEFDIRDHPTSGFQLIVDIPTGVDEPKFSIDELASTFRRNNIEFSLWFIE
jgi:hypothetical protein